MLGSGANDLYPMMMSPRVTPNQTNQFVSTEFRRYYISDENEKTKQEFRLHPDKKQGQHHRKRRFRRKSHQQSIDITNHPVTFNENGMENAAKADQSSRKFEKYNNEQHSTMPPPNHEMTTVMILGRKYLRNKACTATPITPPCNPDGYHFTNLSDGTPVYSSSPLHSRWIGNDEEGSEQDISANNNAIQEEKKTKIPTPSSRSKSLSQGLPQTKDISDQGIISVGKSSNFPIAQSSSRICLRTDQETKPINEEPFIDLYCHNSCTDDEFQKNENPTSITNDENILCDEGFVSSPIASDFPKLIDQEVHTLYHGKKRKTAAPISNESSQFSDRTVVIEGLKGGKDAGEEDETRESNTNEPLFKDIIGHQSVKLRLDEVLLPLALPNNLSKTILTGVRSLAASIFMYGPPGCGKTQLAKAVAGEARAAFLSIAPSDILSKYVGESEEAVRSVFAEAVRLAKNNKGGSKCTVLFFDEIDALGQSRGVVGGNGATGRSSGQSGDNSSRRILAELLIQLSKLNTCNGSFDSTLLVEKGDDDIEEENQKEKLNQENNGSGNSISLEDTILDEKQECDDLDNKSTGFDIRDVKIIVVAATNRPEDCDPALIRRFAVQVPIGLPNAKDRRKMLKRNMQGIDHTITKKQFSDISLVTDGWSGSDLQSLAREAAMAPVRECIRRAAKLKRRRYLCKSHGRKEKRNKIGNGVMSNTTTSLERKTCDDGGSENDDSFTSSKKRLLEEFCNLRPVDFEDYKKALVFCFSRMYNNLHDSPLTEFGWIDEGTGSRSANNYGLIEHYDSSSDEDE